MNDNTVVRISRICHEYEHVALIMVVGAWNTQRVNRMVALCGSILTVQCCRSAAVARTSVTC
jgi:hypothetical protein